jgi:hypothetical protein
VPRADSADHHEARLAFMVDPQSYEAPIQPQRLRLDEVNPVFELVDPALVCIELERRQRWPITVQKLLCF